MNTSQALDFIRHRLHPATGRVDHLEETLGGWLVRLRPKET